VQVLLVVALLGTLLAQAQPPPADPLTRLDGLIGRWRGTTEGQPGEGTAERDYARVLNGRFVRVQNRSVYPPQGKNPAGEVHEDTGMISVDRARGRLVFRQFHAEGFVNQYVEGGAAVPGRLVFTSEAIENIPAGFRARETYVLQGPDAFEETFELAEPGKEFTVYSRSRFTRVK
jgi:hypothetical protein